MILCDSRLGFILCFLDLLVLAPFPFSHHTMLFLKVLALALCFELSTAVQPIKAPLKRHPEHPLAPPRCRSLIRRQQQNAPNTNTSAEQQLYNANRKGYTVEVYIGTPPKAFDMIIDTGSPTVWLPGKDCPDAVCPGARFDPSNSSSYKAANTSFSIHYSAGGANGTYGSDTMAIANLSVTDQVFGLANSSYGTTITYNGTARTQHGVLGLSYPHTGAPDAYAADINFVFNLANRSIISNPIFSIFLDSTFQDGYSGEITFGGIDDSRHNGTIQYAPVMPYTSLSPTATSTLAPTGFYLYWTLAGTAVKASTGYSTALVEPTGFVLDSGTTFTYVPIDVAQNLVNSIAGMNVSVRDPINHLYIVPCNLSSSGKTVTFSIASSLASPSVNPLEMTIGVRELLVPLDAGTPEEATTCGFGITSFVHPNLASVSASYILGETVLRSFYTVYDIGQNRIGLAQAKLSSQKPSSEPTSSANGVTPQGNVANAGKKHVVANPFMLFVPVTLLWVSSVVTHRSLY
ncbi:aspartic peptidase domain-containing protein [Dichotomocladium elegans]|nr:aspartic peptidase domain-containing protein [Dichotomocladium elegans]